MKNNNVSKSDMCLMLDVIHESLSCQCIESYLYFVESFKSILDFSCIRSVFGDRLEYSARKMNGFQMLTQFPLEWEVRYNERDYFLYDKIACTAFRKGGLHHWKDCTEQKFLDETIDNKSDRVMNEAAEFGLRDGWLYSMQCQSSTEWSVISIAGQKCEGDKRTRYILKHLAPHLCLALQRVATQKNKDRVQLSPREYEVLSWSANGKTAWETSEIMKISRRTVEFHMGNILKKLDAINSQQAVAIAISTGLITY